MIFNILFTEKSVYNGSYVKFGSTFPSNNWLKLKKIENFGDFSF